MLEAAYSSVSVEKKEFFTEANLRKVIEDYETETKESFTIEKLDNALKILYPQKPFDLINVIEMKLGKKHTGFKLIDKALIVLL